MRKNPWKFKPFCVSRSHRPPKVFSAFLIIRCFTAFASMAAGCLKWFYFGSKSSPRAIYFHFFLDWHFPIRATWKKLKISRQFQGCWPPPSRPEVRPLNKRHPEICIIFLQILRCVNWIHHISRLLAPPRRPFRLVKIQQNLRVDVKGKGYFKTNIHVTFIFEIKINTVKYCIKTYGKSAKNKMH